MRLQKTRFQWCAVRQKFVVQSGSGLSIQLLFLVKAFFISHECYFSWFAWLWAKSDWIWVCFLIFINQINSKLETLLLFICFGAASVQHCVCRCEQWKKNQSSVTHVNCICLFLSSIPVVLNLYENPELNVTSSLCVFVCSARVNGLSSSCQWCAERCERSLHRGYAVSLLALKTLQRCAMCTS